MVRRVVASTAGRGRPGARRGFFAAALALALAALAFSAAPPAFGEGTGGWKAAPSAVLFASPPLLQGQYRSAEPLGKGKFLVAARNLVDPNFSETVVLLLDYGGHGAVGLVINRPTQVRLSEVLPDVGKLDDRADTVYAGGPVATAQMSLLAHARHRPEGAHRVFDGVYVSSSQETLRQIVGEGGPQTEVRVYAGYAGWAPGQLDDEVATGDWHVWRADANTIFDKAPADIWPELIRRSSAEWTGALRTICRRR